MMEEFNNPTAILADLTTNKTPCYEQYDYSSCNGTTKALKHLAKISQGANARGKSGIDVVNAVLQSYQQNTPELHAKLTGKQAEKKLTPEEAKEARTQEVVNRVLDLASHSPQDESLQKVSQALKSMDKLEIYDIAAEISQLDDLHIEKIQIILHDLFGRGFPERQFYRLIGEQRIRQERIARRKPITTLRTIRNTHYDPRSWLVDGIIPEVGLIALAGKGKIGKSWLGLDFGIALATGGRTMQSLTVTRRKVLYIALEDDEQRLQERANILLQHGNDIDALDNLLILNDCERLDKEGIAYLESIIQAHPDLKTIIIDPWIKVKPRTRGHVNGYDADYDSLDAIYRLAYKHKICIVIYFHLRKLDADDPLDALNATSGVGACVDGALILKRQRQESAATLSRIGRLYHDDSDIDLEFNGGQWKILDGEAKARRLSEQRKEIITVLEKHKEDGLSPSEIADALGKKDNNIRQLLMKMSNDNDKAINKRGGKYFPLESENKKEKKTDNTDNAITENNAEPINQPVEQAEQNVTALSRYRVIDDLQKPENSIVSVIDSEVQLWQ